MLYQSHLLQDLEEQIEVLTKQEQTLKAEIVEELVKFDLYSNDALVAHVSALSCRSHEYYDFTYSRSWLSTGYSIDPTIEFSSNTQRTKDIPPCLRDIIPDRCGSVIQKRRLGYTPSSLELLLGANDAIREGSLRVKVKDKFVNTFSQTYDLSSLEILILASFHVEQGCSSEEDLDLLYSVSATVGGARPKVCLEIEGKQYIAKLPSFKDNALQVSRIERLYLDLAKTAGINACSSKLIETKFGDVLLLQRFDRAENNSRIPFMSAMTALGLSENDELENYSYVDLAMSDFMTSKEQKHELFRRMVFNGLLGNTDDHLRNHAFLRVNGKWKLSPAYDLTPNTVPYNKQHHALCFIAGKDLPSLELFDDIKGFFDVDDKLYKSIMLDMKKAQESSLTLLKKNKVSPDNIKLLQNNFEHEDFEKLKSIV